MAGQETDVKVWSSPLLSPMSRSKSKDPFGGLLASGDGRRKPLQVPLGRQFFVNVLSAFLFSLVLTTTFFSSSFFFVGMLYISLLAELDT